MCEDHAPRPKLDDSRYDGPTTDIDLACRAERQPLRAYEATRLVEEDAKHSLLVLPTEHASQKLKEADVGDVDGPAKHQRQRPVIRQIARGADYLGDRGPTRKRGGERFPRRGQSPG